MKVSVVVPAHNEEWRITGTLKAVLAQDFSDFEVIVVDNASTDRTAAVVRSFEGVILVREDRKGTQFARERGRRQARGEILAYLDADCRPPRGWLATGVAMFSRPEVSGVSGPYRYYDAGPWVRMLSSVVQNYLFPVVHRPLQFLKRGGVMIGGNSFFRASALEKIGGFNTSITFWGDDTDTAKRLSTTGKLLWKGEITVASSARRLEQAGALRLFTLYLANFFWIMLFNRPFSKQ